MGRLPPPSFNKNDKTRINPTGEDTMARSGDPFETLLLSLELLRRIPRGRKITAKQLHQQLADAGFERDLRSIQRLLESLSQHLDIEKDDRNKPYGYRWMEKAKPLAVPNLTPQESLLLQLAEEQLRNLLPQKVMKSMEGFFTQARRNLGSDSTAKLEREWASKVRVVATTQPLLPPKIATGVLDAVSEALYNNHWLKISYQNADGWRMQKQIMPLGLVQQGVSLYLVCRFEGFDDNRNLALHRIQSAEVSTLSFTRPAFDLKQYDADGHFGFGDGQRVQLSFRITRAAGNHLLETPLSQDQQAEDKGDYLDITATVVDSLMLQWWLNGFGDDVSRVRREKTE